MILTAVENVARGLSDVRQNDIVLPKPLPVRQEANVTKLNRQQTIS